MICKSALTLPTKDHFVRIQLATNTDTIATINVAIITPMLAASHELWRSAICAWDSKIGTLTWKS
jgi:hypothetical protein